MDDSKMIDDLLLPSAYPENVHNITLSQTHISNVFIGDDYVYKIKKPVNFGFLDFSTLEKRKYFCHQEVKLNSRFSKNVYLGVFPVTIDDNKYVIDGNGEIVDYAVKMKRLSDKDLLKTRFENKIITKEDIIRIGKTIAEFHKTANTSPEIDYYGTLKSIKLNTDENFEQTSVFINKTITEEQYNLLKNWTERFYQDNTYLFHQRVERKKIKDCHGDLHMEHICLTDPIIIFDCIEFNERFRYIDVLSEISFLLMDIEYHNGKELAEVLCDSYLNNANETSSKEVYDLITFYKIYRAYVRGKVTSFILNDSTIHDDVKNNAIITAKKYFDLAESYIS